MKHVGDSVMLYSAISGTINLQFLEGKIKYQEILGENVMPVILLGRWPFQQDNDPKHTSKSTKNWFQNKSCKILEWLSQSPDLIPIENLWWDLKVAAACKPNNITNLEVTAHEEWAKIP